MMSPVYTILPHQGGGMDFKTADCAAYTKGRS
jgi:hypothetical protein